MTTPILSSSEADAFDYVIVGGGTAGCVIASRLTEYLPEKRVLLIEVRALRLQYLRGKSLLKQKHRPDPATSTTTEF